MNKQKGFTLVELLVVIAIVGLLSTLAVVSLNNARLKSRDAKRVADIRQIMTSLEMYYNDNNAYPPGSALNPTGRCLSTGGFVATCGTVIYMSAVPANPTPADANATGCGGTGYTYTMDNSGASYTMHLCLGAVTGGYAGNVLLKVTPPGVK